MGHLRHAWVLYCVSSMSEVKPISWFISICNILDYAWTFTTRLNIPFFFVQMINLGKIDI